MICSTTAPPLSRSSYSAGVAETKITCPTRPLNSSNRSGRLSSAEGSRNPKSTSVCFRDRSPLYIPFNWGTVTWDSSRKVTNPFGK